MSPKIRERLLQFKIQNFKGVLSYRQVLGKACSGLRRDDVHN